MRMRMRKLNINNIKFSILEALYIIDEQRLLDHFLNGITLSIHRPESRIIKEKRIRLAPTMKSIYWPSRNAPNRVHVLSLKNILVCGFIKWKLLLNYYYY